MTAMWKPEYQLNRERREAENPELREKRIASAIASQERNREARKEYMAAYYAKHPEKFKRNTPELREKRNEARREKYAQDSTFRSEHKATVVAWQKANPEKRHANRLKKYGITTADFKAMMDSQGGRCKICDTTEQGFPMVDHCHKSGKVRGLLCMQCNQGIGKMRDSESLLLSAIEYLRKHG